MKGSIVSIMTNIGSPPQNTSMAAYTPLANSLSTTDIISCREFAVGSNGTINVDYTEGGRAVILVPSSMLVNSGICGFQVQVTHSSEVSAALSVVSRLGTLFFAFSITFFGFFV